MVDKIIGQNKINGFEKFPKTAKVCKLQENTIKYLIVSLLYYSV